MPPLDPPKLTRLERWRNALIDATGVLVWIAAIILGTAATLTLLGLMLALLLVVYRAVLS